MMHVETRGHGLDLVLLHGWAMHGGVFAPLADALADDFRIHVVDLPGHGFSRTLPLEIAAGRSDSSPFGRRWRTAPDEDSSKSATPRPGRTLSRPCGAPSPEGRGESGAIFDVTTCAREIASATLPAIWLGWSLGGLVALRAALDIPERVRGLVLVAASPCFVRKPDWPDGVAPEVFAQFAEGLDRDYRATIERFLALETLGSPHAQSELRELRAQVFARGEPAASVLREGLATLDAADLRGELARLEMPSLWIAGRRDRLVSARAMRRAAELAPRARYLETNAGHAPFIGHAEAIAGAIRQFAGAEAAR
jgi:pimeloyl-[acyl-carrier protein] methyl ester esterase